MAKEKVTEKAVSTEGLSGLSEGLAAGTELGSAATSMTEAEAEESVVDSAAARTSQALDPDLIHIDPVIHNLRRWTGNSKQESEIESLKEQIKADGQQTPGKVRINDAGEFVLVFGERRLEAIKRLRTEDGWENYPFYAEVESELSDIAALHVALTENNERAQFTAIEKAGHIEVVRQMLGLTGMTRKDKEKIAEFFGWKSAASVDNQLLLLQLPEDVQAQVADETMTVAAAIEIARGNMDKAGPVARAAKKLAEKEAKKDKKKSTLSDKALSESQDGEKVLGVSQESGEGSAAASASGKGAAGAAGAAAAAPVVQAKHVRQAQRKVQGSVDKHKAPRMSEFIELIESWDGPVYGDIKSPARRFLQTLAEYGRGKARGDVDKKLAAAFDDLVYQSAGKTRVKTPAKVALKVKTPTKASAKVPAKTPAKTPVKTPGKAPVKASVKAPAKKAGMKPAVKKAAKSKKK